MSKNIFEGAKFGDKFVCINGRIALYISPSDSYENESIKAYSLTIQYQGEFDVLEDGRLVNSDGTYSNDEFDILSRYQEPIDEKELDELAKNTQEYDVDNKYILYKSPYEKYTAEDLDIAFKAGYRKALRYDE